MLPQPLNADGERIGRRASAQDRAHGREDGNADRNLERDAVTHRPITGNGLASCKHSGWLSIQAKERIAAPFTVMRISVSCSTGQERQWHDGRNP